MENYIFQKIKIKVVGYENILGTIWWNRLLAFEIVQIDFLERICNAVVAFIRNLGSGGNWGMFWDQKVKQAKAGTP